MLALQGIFSRSVHGGGLFAYLLSELFDFIFQAGDEVLSYLVSDVICIVGLQVYKKQMDDCWWELEVIEILEYILWALL